MTTPTYEFHPFADIWPLLEGEGFDEFATDIAAHGLRVAILLYQGKVLDGRNRYRACLEAGVAMRFEQADVADDDAALDLVVSLNHQRRHLSYEQRAFAAARLATFKNGAPLGNKRAAKETGISDEIPVSQDDANYYHCHSKTLLAAAKSMDVTPAATKRARAVLTYAPELEKDVVGRKISLSRAVDKVRPKRKPPVAASAPGEARAAYQRGLENRRAIPNLSTLALTPEQVDPDFKGTPNEFATKYGHVNLRTATQLEAEAATKRTDEWLVWMRQCLDSAPKAEADEDDLLIWIRGNGTDPGYRRDKLAKRWAEFNGLHGRLAARLAQLESRLTGKPVEVRS